MRGHPRLPTARLISNEPTAAQVKWVMRATLLAFAAFFIIFVIGNHIPKT